MDILYVVGKGSSWKDNELRYSLRSIEKNCKNVGHIFIAGYCPSFINQSKATFVPVENEFDYKHMNIMRCIEMVVNNCDISDDFLYSSDDHFYVKPTNFADYPFYRKSHDLPIIEDENNSYELTLYYTRKILEEVGLTTHNFSWHGNTHFNKTLFLEPEFMALWNKGYDTPRGIEPTILMLNYWLSRKPFKITDREDNKFPTLLVPDRLSAVIKTRECISSASDMPELLKQWLMREFPNKSKYEK